MRANIFAVVINANARKVCLVDHLLTQTGRAKTCEVHNISWVLQKVSALEGREVTQKLKTTWRVGVEGVQNQRFDSVSTF